jgi:hypothetical protein
MEETAPQSAPAPKLGKEERSRIATEAATRRWAKQKREAAAKAAAAARPVPKASPAKKRPTATREFQSALKVAEKRLGKAILERAEAANKYAVLCAEIPSLQRLVIALKNPLGTVPEYSFPAAPSLEQIVAGEPLPYQNPPRAAAPQVPLIPVPQQLHPANQQQNRAVGGAVGLELDDDGNDDQFLDKSGVAGGQWH